MGTSCIHLDSCIYTLLSPSPWYGSMKGGSIYLCHCFNTLCKGMILPKWLNHYFVHLWLMHLNNPKNSHYVTTNAFRRFFFFPFRGTLQTYKTNLTYMRDISHIIREIGGGPHIHIQRQRYLVLEGYGKPYMMNNKHNL